MNHCDMYPSLRCFRERFVILAQPAATPQPRQCPLNYPPSGQQRKLMTATRSPDDLQRISGNCLRPLNQTTCVARISPNQPQPPKPSHHLRNDQLRPVSVLYVSGVDYHGQQHPHSIYDDVPLSTLDLLASVIAARAPFFSRLHRLTVYDCRAWFRVSSRRLANGAAQCLIGLRPSAVKPPLSEVPPDGAPRRKVARQRAPGAPVPQNAQDAVDHLP